LCASPPSGAGGAKTIVPAPRKFNFEDTEVKSPNVAEAIEAKKRKFDQQAAKLVADEKRWLRKKRLANTKLKNITRMKRNVRSRRRAFEKTVKGTVYEKGK